MNQGDQISNKRLSFFSHCGNIQSYFFNLIERIILLKKFELFQPQLFILGLPRSGTTLVYQYIVHRLNVSYFTNGVGKYFLSPCLTTFIQKNKCGIYRSDFRSNYGKVLGSNAPREAGDFWGRFFGFEKYISFEELSFKDIRTMQNTIACIQNVFGNKPFVNKNVKHMLRIDALSKVFPKSYFLLLERNLNDVALSNIRAKYRALKNPKEWWSVKPQNYELLKNFPIANQVASQLVALNKKIKDDLLKVPSHRLLHLSYEQFCNEPENLINSLSSSFISSGYRNRKIASFKQSINKPQTCEEDLLIKLIDAESASIL